MPSCPLCSQNSGLTDKFIIKTVTIFSNKTVKPNTGYGFDVNSYVPQGYKIASTDIIVSGNWADVYGIARYSQYENIIYVSNLSSVSYNDWRLDARLFLIKS